MPTWSYGFWRNETYEKRRIAERQVRAKFPKLIEGSSGWHRAVENRMSRIRL